MLAGGKKSIARVTLLVGANMDGTEKLPVFMIAKVKSPDVFVVVKLCHVHMTRTPTHG